MSVPVVPARSGIQFPILLGLVVGVGTLVPASGRTVFAFDSPDLGIQNNAIAHLAYTNAKEQHTGTRFPLVLANGQDTQHR
ncbi:hypothetical protein [Halobacteriaceae bacterium SHR40]|uniref:hypothetical protein n=1 Tax=Halovenus amylolytica TaxID=2500550 RepID=UPI000FE4235D